MKEFVLIIVICFFPQLSPASEEEILPLSEFQVLSNGMGDSGPVTVSGKRNEAGKLSELTVQVFGKTLSVPPAILEEVSSRSWNGVSITLVINENAEVRLLSE